MRIKQFIAVLIVASVVADPLLANVSWVAPSSIAVPQRSLFENQALSAAEAWADHPTFKKIALWSRRAVEALRNIPVVLPVIGTVILDSSGKAVFPERADAAEFEIIQPTWMDPAQDTLEVNWAKPGTRWKRSNIFWAEKKTDKSAWVKAEQASQPGTAVLRENGMVRSYIPIARNDWIVTKGAEQLYPLPPSKFRSRYALVPGRKHLYRPRPQPVRMVEVSRRVRYKAPWGEWHYAEPGDVMAWLSPNDIYVIHQSNFEKEYKRISPPSEKSDASAYGTEIASGLESITGVSVRPDSESPLVAVLDAHGILVEPTWRDEYADAYQTLTGVSEKRARAWVKRATIGREEPEIYRQLARDLGRSYVSIQRAFEESRNRLREESFPAAKKGALEMIQRLHELGVPIVVISGSPTKTVRAQLEARGFMKYIKPEYVIGRDAVDRMTGIGVFRDRAVEGVADAFPNHKMIYFNDWIGSFDLVKKLGGRIFAMAQGKGGENEQNRRALIARGADFIMDGWKALDALIKELKIDKARQLAAANQKIPAADYAAKELAFVLAAPLEPKEALRIEVSQNMKTLTYSREDADGITPLRTFPSQNLVSPIRYIQHHLPKKIGTEILRLWNLDRRITMFRGIKTRWDKAVDRDVWAYTNDTGHLHIAEAEARLFKKIRIRKAAEVDFRSGHGTLELLEGVPELEEITFSDSSAHAIRGGYRELLTSAKTWVKLRPMRGRGLRTFPGDYDYIKINPLCIPSRPGDPRAEKDAYGGTNLIKEVLEVGVSKLNPFNPEASIVINISSVAQYDWNRYVGKFGDRWVIEPLGPPRRVPLKINMDEAWLDWLAKERGLVRKEDPKPWQEPYEHTLQAYRLRPRLNVPEVLDQEIQSYQKVVDRFAKKSGPTWEWIGSNGPPKSTKRLGIFGLTANPVQNGHVELVEASLQQKDVDDVVIVLAVDHTDKGIGPNDATLAERMAMIRRTFGDRPHVYFAFSKSGYYLDFMKELKPQYPTAPPVFLMGTDSLERMGNHNTPEQLREFVKGKSTFRVFPRYGDKERLTAIWAKNREQWPASFTRRVNFQGRSLAPASSSLARVLCGDGDPLYRTLVPQAAAQVIEMRNLYRQRATENERAKAMREYFEWVQEKFQQLKLKEMAQWLRVWPSRHGQNIRGRGVLWYDGINYASDALITRINPTTGQREFLRGLRKANNKWAFPGGFRNQNKGESAMAAASRELEEETGLKLSLRTAKLIYEGLVDDDRNTADSKIHTSVLWYELTEEEAAALHPVAGSDLKAVEWCALDSHHMEGLHANHSDILRIVLAVLKRGGTSKGQSSLISANLLSSLGGAVAIMLAVFIPMSEWLIGRTETLASFNQMSFARLLSGPFWLLHSVVGLAVWLIYSPQASRVRRQMAVHSAA